MTTDQIIQLAIELGPAFLGIVGIILAAVIAILGWLAKQVWASHTKRMSGLTKCVSDLVKAQQAHQDGTAVSIRSAESAVQGLRAELHLAQQKWEHIRVGLMGCEVNIKSQENKITEHLRELVKIGSQLEAVFRFMDAPRRASDKG